MPVIPGWVKTVLLWGSILGGVYLFARFLLPFVLPFLLGAFWAALMEPAVKLLQKHCKLPRPLAAGLLTGLVVSVLLFLIWLLIDRIAGEISGVLEKIPEWMSKLPEISESWEERMTVWIEAAPVSLQAPLRQSLQGLLSGGISIPASVYTSLAGWISGAAASLPSVILFGCAVVFSSFLISADYPGWAGRILHAFPVPWRTRVSEVKNRLMQTLGKWLKAQGMMVGLTFLLLCIGFIVLRMEAILLPAAMIALVDALPVLGAGMCLVPWSVVSFASGDPRTGIGLLVLYGAIVLVRSFAEPKLLGAQLGMRVLPTFMAMYIGFKAFGIGGMIVFPILAVTVKQVWDSFHPSPNRTAEQTGNSS